MQVLAEGEDASATSSVLLETGSLTPGLYVLRLEQGGVRLTRPFFVVR